ncbi:MAG: translocation/assembly module TamB domain-containing protein [Gammaproteobacteria bacterium]
MTLRLKFRYWIAIGCAVMIVIVAAGATVLLETEAGLHWTVARVESFSGGNVEIGAAHGHLAGPFTLDRLRVTLPFATVEARRVELDWHPGELLSGQLDIVSINGTGVDIKTRPGNTPSQGLPQQLDLPLHLIISHALFENVEVQSSGTTLRLNRLAFALDADDVMIQLNKLEARGPRLALGGELHVQPHDNWPLQARLSVILRPPGYPTVGGRTRLDGALRGTLQLKQTLKTPFQANLEAKITGLFDTPNVHGTLQVARLDPHAIRSTWPELNAAADLAFKGNANDFTTQGTVQLDKTTTQTVNLDLEAGVAERRVRIKRLNLALAGTPMKLAGHGTVEADAPHRVDLTLAWQGLHWPLQGTPMATAAAGDAHLTGTLEQWRLELRTLLRPRDLPQGRWALSAEGNPQTITLGALAGRWLDGTIAGHGQLQLAAGHPFQFSARVNGVQAHSLYSKIQGHLKFDLAADGQIDPLRARARISGLEGQLQGETITGKADLAYAVDTLTVHTLTLAAGPNHVEAKGRLGARTDLTWRVLAPRLSALGNGLGGQLDAHGSIQGTTDAPRFEATLAATKLHWHDLSIAQAQARTVIDLRERSASSLELHIKQIERGGIELDQLDALLEGPRQKQHFLFSIRGNEGDVELAGTGHLEQSRWTGQLTTGHLRPARGLAFNLTAPTSLVLGAKQLELERNCWQGPAQAQLCLAAASDASGWKAHLALQQIPLSLANPYLTDGLTLRGTLNGHLAAAGGNGTLHVMSEIHAGQGAVIRSFGGKSQRLAFNEAGLETRMNDTQVTARLGVILDDGGLLDATADIPWRTHVRPAGKLHLRARLPDLSGLGALSNAVTDVAGRLYADLRVSGSLEAPRFQGTVHLSRAALNLTRFGTRIRNGNLTLHGTGPGLDIDGTLDDAEKGQLGVQGKLRQQNGQWALKAHVGGKDFQVTNMPEARVSVSPDLDIGVKGYAVTLDGSIEVPSAQIRPPHFSSAIAPTTDLVIVGEKQAQTGPPWRLTTQLRIRLGDNVHFVGYGLSARVGGAITINDTPDKLTIANGELKILDGHYKAYGQDLNIQRGRLLFSGGPIANPGLDIRAVRTVDLVTAGLQITGTLRNPQLRVFSDPPMSQSDALAYLLFGHGMQQTNGSQQSVVNRAANAIGIAGGTYLVKSLGKHVGIDTVSVENANPYTNNANQASLFLGRYLSPRLYVSYGIGLYAPINLLRIRYTLSRHWALEAESGTFSGADILFNIEH